MISHRHRCIYVKASKCGSTTLLDVCGSLWGANLHTFYRDHGDREYGPGRIALKIGLRQTTLA